MAEKDIISDTEARERIMAGVDKLANAVKITLGPTGRFALMEKPWGAPTVTKDGASVAKEITLKDPFENMGAMMVREVSSLTSDEAGDGTTTATVLAQFIAREGLKLVEAGHDPMILKRGIDLAVEQATQHLEEMASPVQSYDDIKQVAVISTNGDEKTGTLLADALSMVGKDGVITVEDGKGLEDAIRSEDGVKLERGYVSSHFLGNAEFGKIVLDDPFVLLSAKRLENVDGVYHLMEAVAGEGRPLLVIAPDVVGDALSAFVKNRRMGSLNGVAIKAPGFGKNMNEQLEDLAILTGGKVLNSEYGLTSSAAQLSDLGTVSQAVIREKSTILVDGGGTDAALSRRVQEIQAEAAASGSTYDVEKLQKRAAALVGGVAVISIGAATEAEMKERKARIEDALQATRAASEEGILPGGGTALIHTGCLLGDFYVDSLEGEVRYGAEIIRKACRAPLSQILKNTGVEAPPVLLKLEKITDMDTGYNAATGEFEDLIEAGIVDPLKVTRTALQNAASVAGMLLTVEAAIAEAR